MLLIFVGSTDVLSHRHTSRFLVPFLRWLWPGISGSTLDQVHLVVRKAGHVSEYAILAALIWRGLRRPAEGPPRGWSWREPGQALALSVAYAATDELHQMFVSTRHASVYDVLIDGCGAGVGLLLVWVVGHWRKRW
jgi:VanZ family protein